MKIIQIVLGITIGFLISNTINVLTKKQREQAIYDKAALEVTDYLLYGARVGQDTTKVVCMDIVYKKDTIHIPMFSKKIKTKCN